MLLGSPLQAQQEQRTPCGVLQHLCPSAIPTLLLETSHGSPLPSGSGLSFETSHYRLSSSGSKPVFPPPPIPQPQPLQATRYFSSHSLCPSSFSHRGHPSLLTLPTQQTPPHALRARGGPASLKLPPQRVALWEPCVSL